MNDIVRYVIVCVVKGEAGEFNDKLRNELYIRFKARASKLPPHFTIKAPFQHSGDISEVENAIEKSIKGLKAAPFKINGYNNFEDRVVYMDVKMSSKGKEIHDRLIDELSKVPYIQFTETDGKDKIFHVTLASKKIRPIFNEIWNYVNQYECDFTANFDNVCIYKWNIDTWELYKVLNIV